MGLENEEIRLRCIEAAAKQSPNFLETLSRAEKFFNYVKGIKEVSDTKPRQEAQASVQEEIPATARARKGPVNLAENVKAYT